MQSPRLAANPRTSNGRSPAGVPLPVHRAHAKPKRTDRESRRVKRYLFADLTVCSTVDLPELCDSEGPNKPAAHITFDMEEVPYPEPALRAWVHLRHPISGDALLSLGKSEDSFILSFPALAVFSVSAAGDRITAWPRPGCTMLTLRHLLLDQVLPRVIALRGRLVLHASAVEIGGSAVAFAGPSGYGKSTLAASFHAAGFQSLTDDALIVTEDGIECTARALYPGLRLWPSSIAALAAGAKDGAPMAQYSAKCRVQLPQQKVSSDWPLAALFVLTEPPAAKTEGRIKAENLTPRDACMAIIRSSFHLDVTDTQRAADLLQTAGDVVNILPTVSLAYPRDFSRLPEVQDIILRRLAHRDGLGVLTPTTAAGLS